MNAKCRTRWCKAAFSLSREVIRNAHIHIWRTRNILAFFIYINPIKSALHSLFGSLKSVSSGFSLGRRLSGHISKRINVETNSSCPALPLYPVLFNSIYSRNDNTRREEEFQKRVSCSTAYAHD